MWKAILGTSPRTTIIGYLTAIASALIPIIQNEGITTRQIAVAIGIAILGRFAGDSKQVKIAAKTTNGLPNEKEL